MVTVRRARSDDKVSIYEIFLEARTSLEAQLGLSSLMSALSEEVYFWVQDVLLATPEILVAEDSDGVCGFSAIDGEELLYICVATSHRRNGIGTRLLSKTMERSAGRLVLDVFERNSGAIRFYERHGFVTLDHSNGRLNEGGIQKRRMDWRRNTKCP